MAVRSKNTHWRMQEILPRHWLALGQRQGIVTANGQGAEAIMADMAAQTPQVLATVQAQLPHGFPARVAEPILAGLEAAASKLLNL
jgi:serine/threonine-protein kinase HipA